MIIKSLYSRFTGREIIADKGAIFVAILAFLTARPYFVWHTSIPVYALILMLFMLLVHNRLRYSRIGIVFIFAILYLWIALRGPFTFIGALSVFPSFLIFFADESFVRRSFLCYKSIFSITLIPSLIIFILGIVTGFDLSFSQIEPLNSIKDGVYRQYPFLVVYEAVSGFPMLRFNGYYDEPGLLGTISAILLISDNCNMKKLENWVILLSGICSLSLFFFVLIGLYILIFSDVKIKVLILMVGSVIVSLAMSIEYLRDSFFSRFLFENGRLSGDNRTDASYDIWYSSFISSKDIFLGLGGTVASEKNYGGASYKDLIVTYGVIHFILYVLSFLLFYLKVIGKNKYFLICSLMFLCVIYQRPSISDFYYIFLFIGPACTIKFCGNYETKGICTSSSI